MEVGAAGDVDLQDAVGGFGVEDGKLLLDGAELALQLGDLVFVGDHLGMEGLVFHDEAVDFGFKECGGAHRLCSLGDFAGGGSELEGDALGVGGGELAGHLVLPQFLGGVGEALAGLLGDALDGGIVGDIERGDAVEVFLQLGKWAFAVVAVHDRAVICKALGGVVDEADECSQYLSADLGRGVGEAGLVFGGEAFAEFIGELVFDELVWLGHGEDGEGEFELACQRLAGGIVGDVERAVFVVAFLLQPNIVFIKPVLGELGVLDGHFLHEGEPVLLLALGADTDGADGFEGHVGVVFPYFAFKGGMGLEAVAPKLLDSAHGFAASGVGLDEVGGEFVVGLALAGVAKVGGCLPECGFHKFRMGLVCIFDFFFAFVFCGFGGGGGGLWCRPHGHEDMGVLLDSGDAGGV